MEGDGFEDPDAVSPFGGVDVRLSVGFVPNLMGDEIFQVLSLAEPGRVFWEDPNKEPDEPRAGAEGPNTAVVEFTLVLETLFASEVDIARLS